jgi:acetyl-CoA carboxylase biotin carboxyl carrier protein
VSESIERRVVVPVGVEHEMTDANPAGTVDGLATISRLADDLLPTLITRIDASTLGELEVRRDSWCIRLRRDASRHQNGAAPARPGRQAQDTVEPPDQQPQRRDPDPQPGTVTAPAVGYYLPPDNVSVGMNVRGGDLLGHVDVLGVRVEVVVPVDGRLTRVLAEPGEAVEYGQPLARLEAESRA